MRIVGRVALAVVVALLINGCANEIKFATNKDKLYQDRITRTILVTSTPDNALDITLGNSLFNEDFYYYARMIGFLKTGLESSGVSVQVVKIDPLAVDPNKAIEKVKEQFNAKALFTVDVGNRDISNFHPLWGRMFSQSYEIQMSITDTVSQRVVWRSSFKVAQDYNGLTMDKNMRDVAARIVTSLKDDNLI